MYKLKECPTAHVISGILNVVNVVRHYLVMERYFPDTNLRDMRPLLVQDTISMTSDSLLRTILRGRCGHSMVGPSPATHSCTSIMIFRVNNIIDSMIAV